MSNSHGSDIQETPDWWIASDGRWYPPELHPDYVAPAPAAPVAPTATPSVAGAKETVADVAADSTATASSAVDAAASSASDAAAAAAGVAPGMPSASSGGASLSDRLKQAGANVGENVTDAAGSAAGAAGSVADRIGGAGAGAAAGIAGVAGAASGKLGSAADSVVDRVTPNNPGVTDTVALSGPGAPPAVPPTGPPPAGPPPGAAPRVGIDGSPAAPSSVPPSSPPPSSVPPSSPPPMSAPPSSPPPMSAPPSSPPPVAPSATPGSPTLAAPTGFQRAEAAAAKPKSPIAGLLALLAGAVAIVGSLLQWGKGNVVGADGLEKVTIEVAGFDSNGLLTIACGVILLICGVLFYLGIPKQLWWAVLAFIGGAVIVGAVVYSMLDINDLSSRYAAEWQGNSLAAAGDIIKTQADLGLWAAGAGGVLGVLASPFAKRN